MPIASRLELELERACKLLESAAPQALEESARVLESVAGELTANRGAIGIEEARRIREAARKARFLLDSADRFHARWRALLAGMAAGYNALGAPADPGIQGLATSRRVSVSG